VVAPDSSPLPNERLPSCLPICCHQTSISLPSPQPSTTPARASFKAYGSVSRVQITHQISSLSRYRSQSTCESVVRNPVSPSLYSSRPGIALVAQIGADTNLDSILLWRLNICSKTTPLIQNDALLLSSPLIRVEAKTGVMVVAGLVSLSPLLQPLCRIVLTSPRLAPSPGPVPSAVPLPNHHLTQARWLRSRAEVDSAFCSGMKDQVCRFSIPATLPPAGD
jgi:hypothetical protein